MYGIQAWGQDARHTVSFEEGGRDAWVTSSAQATDTDISQRPITVDAPESSPLGGILQYNSNHSDKAPTPYDIHSRRSGLLMFSSNMMWMGNATLFRGIAPDGQGLSANLQRMAKSKPLLAKNQESWC